MTRGIGLNLLFTAGVCAAWAWFSVAPSSPTGRYHFSIQTNIPGWHFEPISLNAKVLETLATTNLINGTFHGPNGERISIFLGEWDAGINTELSVVLHTPDVCWMNAGWVPVKGDFGTGMDLKIRQETVPFALRAFRPPQGGHEEITVWCTLVDGKIYCEGVPLLRQDGVPSKPSNLSMEILRLLTASHFQNAVKHRTRASHKKQYIRISAPNTRSSKITIQEIEKFACYISTQLGGENDSKNQHK